MVAKIRDAWEVLLLVTVVVVCLLVVLAEFAVSIELDRKVVVEPEFEDCNEGEEFEAVSDFDDDC